MATNDVVRTIQQAVTQAAQAYAAVDPGFPTWLATFWRPPQSTVLIVRALKAHPTIGPALRALEPRLFDPATAAAEEPYASGVVDWAIVAVRSSPGHWHAWLDAFKPSATHTGTERDAWRVFLDTYAPTGVEAVKLALGPLDEFEMHGPMAGRPSLATLVQTPAGREHIAKVLGLHARAGGLPAGPWDDVLDKTRKAEFDVAVRKSGIDANTLWPIAVLYRAEWNIPWHSAFSFAADYLKTPRGSPPADVVLEHSVGTGTLFAKLAREDNEIAKKLGMNWSRREGFWYRASSRGRQLPTVVLSKVVRLAQAKGRTVALRVTPPGTAEEAREAYREAMAAKAEHFEARAAKHAATSQSAYDQVHGIMDRIVPGQPILVGHHSERRHRRDIERMDAGMRKSIEAEKAAALAAERAAHAAYEAEHGRPTAETRRVTTRGSGRVGLADETLALLKRELKKRTGAARVTQEKSHGRLQGYTAWFRPRPGALMWDRKMYVVVVHERDGEVPRISVHEWQNPAFPVWVALTSPAQGLDFAVREIGRFYADPAYAKTIPVRGREGTP